MPRSDYASGFVLVAMSAALLGAFLKNYTHLFDCKDDYSCILGGQKLVLFYITGNS